MRILFALVHYHPYIGGAELIVQRLAEGLAQKGHRVTVITARLPGTPKAEKIDGVGVHRVWVPRVGSRYAFSLTSIPAILGQARHHDLVHTASYYSSLSAFLGARLARRSVVLTYYEVLGKHWQRVKANLLMSWAAKAVERLMASLPFDRYVAISEATRLDLLEEGLDAARIEVIRPGVDEIFFQHGRSRTGELREACRIGLDEFLYLYYGRPGITKGVEYLVRAAPEIHRQVPNAQLALILADEPQENYAHIQRLIDEARARCNISLVPPISFDGREQLVRYLQDADCIVVPSLTEGFGLTTAETCALRIPVVATRAGSIPEVVSGHHILVEPGSSSALADGVVRAWLGQYDYLPPKEFHWSDMVDQYENLYQELLG